MARAPYGEAEELVVKRSDCARSNGVGGRGGDADT